MSLFSLFSHVFLVILGILCSMSLTIVFVYVYSSKSSHETITRLVLPSKSVKPNIVRVVADRSFIHRVWMFGMFISEHRLFDREHVRAMYVILSDTFLFLHLSSKHWKYVDRTNIAFVRVLVFNLSNSKIHLKPIEQSRADYWSHRTPIVLSQVQYLACYRIIKATTHRRKTTHNTYFKENKSFDRLRSVDAAWFIDQVRHRLVTIEFVLYSSRSIAIVDTTDDREVMTICDCQPI
jgi:hypothetical protein